MSLAIEQCQGLNLLARSTHGHRESILLAHGLPTETLCSLLRDGLIVAEQEPAYLRGGEAIVVTRLRITDAGRRALDDGIASTVPRDEKAPSKSQKTMRNNMKITTLILALLALALGTGTAIVVSVQTQPIVACGSPNC
jgi:hypothetical protein